MPVTGIPLPFMSYGGSNMLANLAAALAGAQRRRQTSAAHCSINKPPSYSESKSWLEVVFGINQKREQVEAESAAAEETAGDRPSSVLLVGSWACARRSFSCLRGKNMKAEPADSAWPGWQRGDDGDGAGAPIGKLEFRPLCAGERAGKWNAEQKGLVPRRRDAARCWAEKENAALFLRRAVRCWPGREGRVQSVEEKGRRLYLTVLLWSTACKHRQASCAVCVAQDERAYTRALSLAVPFEAGESAQVSLCVRRGEAHACRVSEWFR